MKHAKLLTFLFACAIIIIIIIIISYNYIYIFAQVYAISPSAAQTATVVWTDQRRGGKKYKKEKKTWCLTWNELMTIDCG